MAISVPISTEQYIRLKEISDKFGLSLKKTIEHLVSLYYNEMIKDSVEEMKEEENNSPKVHDIEITAPSLIYQQSITAAQVQQHRNLFESPPIRNESPKPIKHIIPPSQPVSSNSSPWANYANTLVENHQTIPKPEIFTVPLYNPSSQGCPSCGVAKNSDAKFCHNCGYSL
ncbi:zinc ribbon domain-containing protein [Candidatus Pacearchaeota archaeon]|nr:zinc ribbon domain-containing protein [Candidatus Pacearchaeota archaeon]